jgi:hypothetical protein
VNVPQNFLDQNPEDIANTINILAGKLANVMGWKAAPGTLFYLPAESNGPLVDQRMQTFWSLAVTAYEQITGVDVQEILHYYLGSLKKIEFADQD